MGNLVSSSSSSSAAIDDNAIVSALVIFLSVAVAASVLSPTITEAEAEAVPGALGAARRGTGLKNR